MLQFVSEIAHLMQSCFQSFSEVIHQKWIKLSSVREMKTLETQLIFATWILL